MSRRLFWLPPLLFATLSPTFARASEIFPITMKTELAMTGPVPPCITCHDTEEGGLKTLNQPVGRRVTAYGLMGGDTQMLATILGQMRDARDDSDGDGKIDVDEIKSGGNPNINDLTGRPPDDYPPPVYGCQTKPTHGRTAQSGGWTLAAAGILLLGWLRRPTLPRTFARSPHERMRRPRRLNAACGSGGRLEQNEIELGKEV
jgi:hypothetical protein